MFSTDNWMCASMIDLALLAEGLGDDRGPWTDRKGDAVVFEDTWFFWLWFEPSNAYCERTKDLPDAEIWPGGWLCMTRYKHRGRISQAYVISEENRRELTLEEAEMILEMWSEVAGDERTNDGSEQGRLAR